MPSFVQIDDVREFLRVDGDPNDGQYSDHLIASNIRTASGYLQRVTRRQFEALASQTLRISTHGEAIVELPDLRSVMGSVTLSGSTRTLGGDSADAWLINDPNHTEVYTALQLRPIGDRLNYHAYADWFDTNKDRSSYWYDGRLPDDLVLTDVDLGWDPLPDELLHATKVLAAWYTKRPDSILANVLATTEGTLLDYSAMPPEVSMFIQSWKRGVALTVIHSG